jgi:hypothetical protein
MLGVSAVMATAAVVLGISGGADLILIFSIAVLGLVFGVIGALVASRLPRNPIGWLFCALALLFAFGGTPRGYADYANVSGPLLRHYPTFPKDPELNFPPAESFRNRSVNLYKAEKSKIDVIMFRITDRQHTDNIQELLVDSDYWTQEEIESGQAG